MKYQNWLNEWLNTCVKPVVKHRTLKRYTDIVRLQIEPQLGEYDLSELTLAVLQKFAAELSEKYACNTVTGIISVVKSSLARAQKTGRVKKQYSDDIEYPRRGEKPVACFTRREQKVIEQYVINSGKSKLYGVVLCLYTGMRVGELLALEWSDVDFKNRRISISKTCTDKWEQGSYIRFIEAPKTSASRREIPLPVQLIPCLKQMKRQSNSGFVISGKDGADLSVRSYQNTFEKMLCKLKIPHRGFHSLRHTFATRALECGMDVKTLSGILGHKSSVVTLNRYAHSMWDHKNTMMNKLGKMLTADGSN